MVRVTATDDPDAQLVLIVDNNPMGTMRLSQIFTQKGWRIEVCEDGDLAVDTYVQHRPELVLLSLDIPTMDGHTAALEMREHGGEARIVFIAPKRLTNLAQDATLSAGAVACLEKPISAASLDQQWDRILGTIPEAPGLEDLDQLYPEGRIKVEEDDGPMPLPPLPGLPLPNEFSAELPAILPPLATTPSSNQPKKKSGKLKLILVVLVLALVGVGYYAYSNNML